ncbi:C-type lectin domain-containing protein [Paraliomyxa miuraensis]|uniref:C-type lectin domain-containing protein n=1 Tax=Paraliomyxa miuraensis TaxID=376150 RepID=UPI00225AFBBA|nr:C-type lectin domain-containing protein [Paraliomyxa miuraensis]MCX4242559.1 C-type lectin domain-containing protein [Paraliomyxa miuraensis]
MTAGSARAIGAVAVVAVLLFAASCGDQVVGHFDGGSGSSAGPASSDTAGEAGTTFTEPPMPEQCNGLDDDHDGLVDEVSAELTECNGCRLLQGEGQAFWVCETETTWAEAQAQCEALGATSAIVPSEATQTFLHEQVGTGWYWLGAVQDPDEGPWRWVDGTAFEYANWGTTQPDDTAPGQDCVRLTFGITGEGWFDGAWDDFFCDEPTSHRVLCSASHAAP